MVKAAILAKNVATLSLAGEEFAVLKKEHLEELLLLVQSATTGERLLRTGKTRNFKQFIATRRKRR